MFLFCTFSAWPSDRVLVSVALVKTYHSGDILGTGGT